MNTLPATALPAPLERQFLEGIHFALEELGRALVAKVTQLVQEQLGGAKTRNARSRQALADAVASEMPAMLETEFLNRLLSNDASARQHRAVLAHLLSAAEVQAVVEHGFSPLPLSAGGTTGARAAAGAGTEEVTSEVAAKLLHVSRTHLNALADTGALGPVRRTEGGHRRLLKSHLLRYLKDTQAHQAQGLDDMMSATDALGLYEHEAKVTQSRRSRRS